MRQYTQLLRAMLPASLMFMAIGGAAVAGLLEDAASAYQRGDYATALRLWRPLADQGNAEAQLWLGIMYDEGPEVPRNDAEAIKWYRKAADQGVALAQFNLGMMYAKGEGAPQNDAEAAQWYRLAADQGLAGAQFNLGIMYSKGRGVPQDYVQAHMWLNLAASQLPDLGKTRRNTTIDARDLVASKMTSAQIAEAQELALEWMIERRHRARQNGLR
jgi:TPR repeat protein